MAVQTQEMVGSASTVAGIPLTRPSHVSWESTYIGWRLPAPVAPEAHPLPQAEVLSPGYAMSTPQLAERKLGNENPSKTHCGDAPLHLSWESKVCVDCLMSLPSSCPSLPCSAGNKTAFNWVSTSGFEHVCKPYLSTTT